MNMHVFWNKFQVHEKFKLIINAVDVNLTKLEDSYLEWKFAVVYQKFKKMTYIFIIFYFYEI